MTLRSFSEESDRMTTLTLYRPIGTAEVALIAQGDWQAFPKMPEGFGFYAYAQPVGDPRKWLEEVEDIEMFEALEYGQAEVVKSWEAWGNEPDDYSVVWFEVGEGFRPNLYGPLDIYAVNRALVGPIEVCARYRSSGVWMHPKLPCAGWL